MNEYIGTIIINPPLVLHLDDGGLYLESSDFRVRITPDGAKQLILDTPPSESSAEAVGWVVGGGVEYITIPLDRTTAMRNVMMRGLERLGIDTQDVRDSLWTKQRTEWEANEGACSEQAGHVDGDGI